MSDHITDIPLKRCTKCNQYFPATPEHFSRNKAGKYGLCSRCKKCKYAQRPPDYVGNLDEITKRCPKCQRVLPLTAFHRQYNRRTSLCKECGNQKAKEKYAKNKEKNVEYARQYRRDNREAIQKRRHEKYLSVKDDPEFKRQETEKRKRRGDKPRENTRRWRQADPVRYYESRRRYEKKHAEDINATRRDLYARNKQRFVINRHRRRAHKKAHASTLTREEWLRCLDYWESCCAICGRPQGLFHKIVPDHWIPLRDPDSPGNVCTNVVPLCHGFDGCNNSKNGREPNEWLEWKYGKRKGKAMLARISRYFEWTKSQP